MNVDKLVKELPELKDVTEKSMAQLSTDVCNCLDELYELKGNADTGGAEENFTNYLQERQQIQRRIKVLASRSEGLWGGLWLLLARGQRCLEAGGHGVPALLALQGRSAIRRLSRRRT